ncbi:hypothetical protein C8A03DRAFT_34948 [Achaetomium macrosporum]|uniref:Uncharacterized protein n=1 Tax=Achaetomium macrosporum TaxID=79813 RepID=A0AAN7C7Z6_9PEZI|nr:hypothetical protein C8A03DRAFT_34948 [Achaetomium macrosporum]
MHFTKSFLSAIAPLLLLGGPASAHQLNERGVQPTTLATSVIPARDLTAAANAAVNTGVSSIEDVEIDTAEEEGQEQVTHSRVPLPEVPLLEPTLLLEPALLEPALLEPARLLGMLQQLPRRLASPLAPLLRLGRALVPERAQERAQERPLRPQHEKQTAAAEL